MVEQSVWRKYLELFSGSFIWLRSCLGRWFNIHFFSPSRLTDKEPDPKCQGLDLSIDLDSDSINTGMDSNWKRLQKTLRPKDVRMIEKSKNIYKSKKRKENEARGGILAIQAVELGQHRVNVLSKEARVKSACRDLTAAKLLMFKDTELKRLTTGDLEASLHLSPEQKEEGNYVAIDCEFVGIGDGTVNALARVSVVNYYGHVLLDEFIRPSERVVDWRTAVSGVRPRDVKNSRSQKDLTPDLLKVLHGKKIVGHALSNDFKVLGYNPPTKLVLDTSLNTQYRKLMNTRSPSLKRLSEAVLNLDIQKGEHSSLEDAQATMCLYRLNKSNFRC